MIKRIKQDATGLTITIRCMGSDKTPAHDWDITGIPIKGFNDWRTGVHAQDAMPDVPVEKREALINGCCPSCWKETFRKEV